MEDSANVSGFGLTVCSWVSITRFLRPTVLFSVFDKDANLWQVTLGILPNCLILKRRGSGIVAVPYLLLYLPLDINFFCLSLSSTSIHLFHNGGTVYSSSYLGEDLQNRNLSIFIGGGEQLPEIFPKTTDKAILPNFPNSNSNNSSKGGFLGVLTDPKLWSFALEKKEIKELYNCGNINEMFLPDTWAMTGENIMNIRVNRSYFCLEKHFDYIILPGGLSFKENNGACKRLNLNLLALNRDDYFNLLNTEAKKVIDACRKDSWLAWLRTEKNALQRQFETTAFCEVLTESGRDSISCKETICSVCQFENKRNLFILRGICSVEEVDLSFVLNKNENKAGFYFHGIENFSIREENSSWVLQYEANKTVIASTDAYPNPLPLGIKEWNIHQKFCGIPRYAVITASLSTCTSYEAICGDGHCIPMSKRCNSYADCSDASDELNCTTILTEEFYDSSSPPYHLTEIQISIDIIRIVSTPPQKSFNLIFETNYQWSDSRVNLSNLNPKLNFRLRNSNLWKPKLSLIALGNPSTRKMSKEKLTLGKTIDLTDSERSTIIASTYNSPVPEKRDKPLIDAVFAGENVTLSVNVLTKQEVECEFDFTFFPFDEQICQLSLVISSWPSYRLSLKSPVIGRYTGPLKLPHYTIANTKAERRNIKIDGKMHDGLIMIFHLKHRNSSLVISVYLPTFILLILNSCTLWMTGHHGTFARVQISGIILIAIMIDWLLMVNYTPQTGYLMAIDAWICFGAIYSIMHMAVHILLDIFVEEHHPDPFARIPSRISSSRVRDVKPVDGNSLYDGMIIKVAQMEAARLWSVSYWILFIARVVSPVLLLFFNCAYWPFVFYFSKLEFS